ncbi:hypothetical protein PLESTF_000010600 [Pleodorina starrii]|nr:hypothetical protein PLESTF_000010600 [Pleodorina starrii]
MADKDITARRALHAPVLPPALGVRGGSHICPPNPRAPLAAVTVAEAVPVCASPRPSLATEGEKEEAPAPDAPSDATAQLSKGPRRKLSKILRGLFGGCVGRNVEAL